MSRIVSLRVVLLLWLSALALVCASPAFASGAGQVYIMRHALAPGFGDPDNIRLGDCSTQRNLSGEGRDQAGRAGLWLRTQGVQVDKVQVLSSPWCRTLETAQLLALGKVQSTSALSSFFQSGSRADTMAELATVLSGVAQASRQGVTTVLVTHQVVISALTGEGVGSGELLRLRLASDGVFERVLQRHQP